MFKRIIEIKIYEAKLTLYVVDDFNLLSSYLKKKYKLSLVDFEDSDGIVFNETDYLRHISVAFLKSQLSNNLIAHEIYHITSLLTSLINIKDEEAGAWLQGYISESIYKILNKKGIVVKY